MIKAIVQGTVTVVVTIAILLVTGLVGGNSQPGVGGDTRFPNSRISTQGLLLTGTGTTTLSTGKVCMAVTRSSGVASYAYFDSTGSLATTSVSCL